VNADTAAKIAEVLHQVGEIHTWYFPTPMATTTIGLLFTRTGFSLTRSCAVTRAAGDTQPSHARLGRARRTVREFGTVATLAGVVRRTFSNKVRLELWRVRSIVSRRG